MCTSSLAENFQFVQHHGLSDGLIPISQCAILISRCSKSVKEEVNGCKHDHDHVTRWRSISTLFQKCTWLWMQMVGKEINYLCHVHLKRQRVAMVIHRTYMYCCVYSWKMGNSNYFCKSEFSTPGFLFIYLYLLACCACLVGFVSESMEKRELVCSLMKLKNILKYAFTPKMNQNYHEYIRRYFALIWLPFRFLFYSGSFFFIQ